MNLTIRGDLPFVTITVTCQGASAVVSDILVDTGAARTIIATDVLAQLGLVLQDDDLLHNARGVGGVEVVFRRRLDRIDLGGHSLAPFEVEVGGMDYGFSMMNPSGTRDTLLEGMDRTTFAERWLSYTEEHPIARVGGVEPAIAPL